MILTAHQPAYLPWLGYFDKIICSDLYVYMDSVQFEKNSFVNRNRIKTPQGPLWLTVPVKMKGHMSSTIIKLEIDNTQNWRKKHLNSIQANYKKVPRFEECYSRLETLYHESFDLLADLCWHQLQFWIKELAINTKVVRTSEIGITSEKSDLVLEFCLRYKATKYISGGLGRNYLIENDFRKAGIEIIYQDYLHPAYPQLWGEFLPNLSIIDFWMNTGNYSLITGGEGNGLL